MSSILCCSSISPYRPRWLDHEPKFNSFMGWAKSDPAEPANGSSLVDSALYVVQLVRQVNYGKRESIRYFVPDTSSSFFLEATEQDLIQANFEKLNSFKNFKCQRHNKFFEVNLYQKNPKNTHHWRADSARPSRDIDLEFRKKEVIQESTSDEEFAPLTSSLDFSSSNPKHNTSPPQSSDPPVTSHQPSEVRSHEKESLAQLLASCLTKASVLKPVLQFLLPSVGTNLGPNSLLSLLCLDWVNKELDLGLDHENLWEAKLTSSNISIFLKSLISPSSTNVISLTEIENLVVRAMTLLYSSEENEVLGRVRFENIVNQVLDSNTSAGWVSENEDKIRCALTSGPSEELLMSCGHSGAEPLNDQLRRITVVGPQIEPHTQGKFFFDDDDDGYDYGRSDDYDYESSGPKDYAACDKECGYCGKCDY
ncbi:hypothetical protein F5Y10DRAFT_256769 [Nemania abortiva]|nr:hypothetical protein F5Y10DRAFT_256769 [Nemania abortiva]